MAKKRGRPPVDVDIDKVRELAAEGNSLENIGRVLHITSSTLKRHDIHEAWKNGRAELEINIRHWQVEAAKSGNVQMLIWLGRNILGQSDGKKEESRGAEITVVIEWDI